LTIFENKLLRRMSAKGYSCMIENCIMRFLNLYYSFIYVLFNDGVICVAAHTASNSRKLNPYRTNVENRVSS